MTGIPAAAPQYLLFDLDGTLVDSLADLAKALNLLRAELDLAPLPCDVVGTMVGDGATRLLQRALGEELYDSRHLRRFLDLYEQNLLDQTRCYPGIMDLLRCHPPRNLAVVTNKPHTLTLKILDGLDLSKRFSVVIGGDSFPHKKPHPYPLLQALQRLGAEPSLAVMIGDHHTDLKAAAAAGCRFCFCTWGFGHDDGLPSDYLARSPRDLTTLFPGSHQ